MINNYSNICEEILNGIKDKKRLLLHSCCGPCSSYVISYLTKYFDITVLYYNPNIEPLEEYEHRKAEQKRLLEILNVKFMDCDYDNKSFEDAVLDLHDEPEGGKRCTVCFGLRLRYTAKLAKKNNFDYFSTTLTVSPSVRTSSTWLILSFAILEI